MIIPCIDLMGGKVVQLVQGREKVLEAQSPDAMLESFAGFPSVQVIDLDAAMNNGSNDQIVEHLVRRSPNRKDASVGSQGVPLVRVGGGVRTVDRARQLLDQGAYRVIFGTSVFSGVGPNYTFLNELKRSLGPERLTIALDSSGGRIVVKGWQESVNLKAVEVISELEPYCSSFLCTYVDKEGMMQGTDLEWFESLRAATGHELIAAGGVTTLDEVKALTAMKVDCAIGMAIYTGQLPLDVLRNLN